MEALRKTQGRDSDGEGIKPLFVGVLVLRLTPKRNVLRRKSWHFFLFMAQSDNFGLGGRKCLTIFGGRVNISISGSLSFANFEGHYIKL